MASCDARTRSFFRGRLGLAVIVLFIAGCGGSAVRWDGYGDRHIVRQGETLFSIAWHYGKDHRDLARWNGLGDGSLIHPGQVIWLRPVASSRSAPSASPASPSSSKTQPKPLPQIPTQPPPKWQWPTDGRVVSAFGSKNGLDTGILIAGARGQPVRGRDVASRHSIRTGRKVARGGGASRTRPTASGSPGALTARAPTGSPSAARPTCCSGGSTRRRIA